MDGPLVGWQCSSVSAAKCAGSGACCACLLDEHGFELFPLVLVIVVVVVAVVTGMAAITRCIRFQFAPLFCFSLRQ